MAKWAYYNEIEPFAAQWLRNLIAAGHIAPGEVDDRSIEDVRPDDLKGFAQAHFFAGIGVWSYALRRAGWPDDRPVWTGSCPCQPFSAAGKGVGFDDERHLWPAWQWLIDQCRPPIVFGEQVASKAVEPWVDLVHTDLEAMGYAFGCVPFPAAGIGAPHIRDRNYWVAYAESSRSGAGLRDRGSAELGRNFIANGERDGGVANCDNKGLEGWWQSECECPAQCSVGSICMVGGLPDAASSGWREERQDRRGGTGGDRPEGIAAGHSSSSSSDGGVDDADCRSVSVEIRNTQERDGQRPNCTDLGSSAERTSPTNGYWRNPDWLWCRDAKWRPVEPGFLSVAHGVAARMGYLRPAQVNQVEEVVREAAIRFSTTRDEILRALRGGDASAVLCERQGGSAWESSEAQVLLTSLFEHSRQKGDEQNPEDDSGEGRSATNRLRMLWRRGEISNSPRQRGLDGQQYRKLTDALRILSSAMARLAQEAGHPVFVANAGASFPLKVRGPHSTENRVGKLRAYGNAIVAQAAEAFVRSAVEALDDVSVL